MDLQAVSSLTRQDLKEELRAFAEGWLGHALQEAMRVQCSFIASEVCKRLEENGQCPLFSSHVLSELEVMPTPTDPVAKRQSLAMAGLDLPTKTTSAPTTATDGNLWRTSMKYEGLNAARPHEDLKSEPMDSPRWATNATYTALSPRVQKSLVQSQALVWQDRLSTIVESAVFEQVSGLLVLLNAISLGYDTNHLATTDPEAATGDVTAFTEPFFCTIFLTEFLLRVGAFGCAIFWMEGWRWNVLDLVLVSTQCLEQMLILVRKFTATEIRNKEHNPNIGIFRILRLLRIVRIARLLRAFHLFDDLRVIVSSIMSSISSLGWGIFLLLILIYVFSLIFLQSIVFAGHTEHEDQIRYWFSSLFRTFLTMFECVVGGVSWDEVVSPIVSDISPFLGVAFCIYIAGCLFAMMNLLTGVFVDKAMMTVREDKDMVLAKRIRDLFLCKHHIRHDDDVDDEEEITWEIFQQKLESQAMKDYFFQINVDITEAHLLFQLMDADGSGSLSSEEIIKACLSLRGPARALELSMVLKDVGTLSQQMSGLETGVRNLLTLLKPSACAQ